MRSERQGLGRAGGPRAVRCWLLLCLLLLWPAGAAWAQEPTASQREGVEIARTLKCPVCESQSVADSPSQLAQEMRAYIQRRLEAGDSRQAIVQALVDRYGEGILLEPPRTGFTLLVWWLPVLSFGLGAVVVALALRRWTRPATAALGVEPAASDLSPDEVVHYRARLAEELARRERGAGVIAAVTLAVFALALAALAYPLVRRPRVARAPDLELLLESDVVEEREAVLSALGELDFDHAVGKVAEDDYRALRDRYERQALALLKATDPERLAGDPAGASGRPNAGRPAPLAEVPPPRLDPVLGEGTVVLRPVPLPAASPVAAYRNGKDHSLHGGRAEPDPPGLPARPPSTVRGRRLALGAVTAAVLFAVGVGAVYFTGSRSQSDQRAVAALEGVGPRGLALVPAGRAFLASAGGLWTSADGGGAWQPLGALDSALRAVAVSAGRPSRAYAVGPGLVARSDDGGQSWVEQRAVLGELFPRPPPAAGDAPSVPADLRALAVDPAVPERLWTVVEGLGLFRSDDGGQSWTPRAASVPPNATALLAVVDAPRGEGLPWLFLASATEGVLASADEGASWAPASGVLNGALPSRRVASLAYDADSGETAVTPDGRTLRGTLYAGTEQGLFKSLDRGQSWGRLPLAASVAAVGAAAGDSPLVLAVDRDGQVYRSRDRGVTWDAR